MTLSGHERTAFAAMHGRNLLYFHIPWVWGQRDEAPRVHHPARLWGGCLAARGARTAAGDTGYRMAARGTTIASGSLGSVPPGLERLGLYRRTQCSRRTEEFGPI